MTGGQVLLWSLAVMAIGIGSLLVVTALGRFIRVRRHIRHQRLRDELRPAVVQLLVDPDVETRLPGVGRRSESLFEVLAFDYLSKVRGDSRAALVRALEARGAIDAAERRLNRPGSVGKAAAAELLGQCGLARSREPLLELLSHRSPEVRLVGARAVGRLRHPDTVMPLLCVIDAKRPVPAASVTQALMWIGPAAVPRLRAATHVASAAQRAVAVETLGLQRAVEAVPDLLAMADDEDEAVRLRAVAALGRIGDPRARETLLRAAAPVDDPLCVVAAHALGDLGDQRAVPALSALLQDARHAVAATAAASLARCGSAGMMQLQRAAEGDGAASLHARGAIARAALGRGATKAEAAYAPFPVAP